jgi:hypothetical protein
LDPPISTSWRLQALKSYHSLLHLLTSSLSLSLQGGESKKLERERGETREGKDKEEEIEAKIKD